MKNYFRFSKKFIFFLIVLFLTSLFFLLKPEEIIYNTSVAIMDEYMFLKTDIIFINIFVTNLIVGFLITYGGFFTFCILTIFIWIWNALIVYIIYSYFINIGTDINLILYQSKHFLLELYAFILFTLLSFRGLEFYKGIFLEKKIRFNLIPKFEELLIPILALFLSSIIEVL